MYQRANVTLEWTVHSVCKLEEVKLSIEFVVLGCFHKTALWSLLCYWNHEFSVYKTIPHCVDKLLPLPFKVPIIDLKSL